jgi:hypothetical protein
MHVLQAAYGSSSSQWSEFYRQEVIYGDKPPGPYFATGEDIRKLEPYLEQGMFFLMTLPLGGEGGVLKFGTAAKGTRVLAIVPKGAGPLGQWGETRLANVLENAGLKPAKPFMTTDGPRYVDRLVNGIAHEAKAGVDVGLTSSIQRQILKDVELIETGVIEGAHWHFFQGADAELLQELTKRGIGYTVHP